MAKVQQHDFSQEVIAKALRFLNQFQSPEEITQKVKDDPNKGSGDPSKSVGIGKVVAYRILTKRSELPNEQFYSLDDLNDISGFGQDKLHDLLYTFAEQAPKPKEIVISANDHPKVREMKALVTTVKAQLMEERDQGMPDRDTLESNCDQLKAEMQSLEDQARRSKDLAKRRKTEIDEWKDWFNQLTPDEQEEGYIKLKSEIDWRADEINALTPEIQELLVRIEEQEGKMQMARQKLIACEQGVYEKPVSEDPRLSHLMHELEKAESATF